MQWWDKSDQETESWDAFVDALHTRFRPAQAPMLARQRLDKLRQRAGQSVNQYSNSFQTTLTPITDMSSADQVHHFINGLLPAIAAKVWERQPTELKAAIDIAVSIEAMSNFGRAAAAAPSSFSRAHGSTASSGSAPMDINHVSNDHEDAETASHCAQVEPPGSDAMLQALLTKMDVTDRCSLFFLSSFSTVHAPVHVHVYCSSGAPHYTLLPILFICTLLLSFCLSLSPAFHRV